LKERERNYKENNKEIDFWLLKNPSFLQTTQFSDLKAKIPSTPAVVLSTDKKFIKIKKLMNIIFYFAFIGFGFGAAFALDKLLRAVKLI